MPATTINVHKKAGMIARLNHPKYARWAAQIRNTNGCRNPIHLRGHITHHDATGAVIRRYSTVHEPDGILRIPCKTRRASRCPACAETYRQDTYHLIRAGLVGGKCVPESVRTHPTLFITLTAPSFGLVHAHRARAGRILPCRPRRNITTCLHGNALSCTVRHKATEQRLGRPLCPECYDYAGTVLFNGVAPLLWKRLITATRRRLGPGVMLSFAKVAEYQRRGVVHFHAILRLDSPRGPAQPPPPWSTTEALVQAVQEAATAVTAATAGRTLRWGTQLDIRPLTEHAASYVAKYATKAAECVGVLDQRISPLTDLTTLPIPDHARRLIAACLDLGLTHWAHMLGFGGHFSTRSRHYGPTLGALRTARQDHVKQEGHAVAHWQYAGRGYSEGDALLAKAITTGGPR
ncbi:replication initiator [Nonomuraea typhae]|uniref:replication initiator n=1 Tax=Nonomuraea typhae TaxID=2603600 RepID=UPI001FE916B0|nr:replication initiator [Nonomuraea typhae]